MPDAPHRPLPEVEGATHSWVTARGLRFHVAQAGAGDDDVVVLLHGFPQHWYEWRHLLPALAAEHRVVAIDLRGHGWSDAPRRGYRKHEMADDVLAVLDGLGLDRVKLVGHDWGGWIGFLLCLAAPERVERLLVLNIVHPWQRFGRVLPHAWRLWYQLVLACPGVGYLVQRTGWLIRLLLRLGVHRRDVWDRRTVAEFTRPFAEPARARAGVRLYRDFLLREFLPVARGSYARGRLTVPTRIVFGTRDAFLSPRLLAGYQQHADDVQVHLVPDCGHFIVDERPDLVAEHAREFLAG